MAGRQSNTKEGSGNTGFATIRTLALTLVVVLAAFLSQRFCYTGVGYQASILSELGPKLSPNASIILPKDTNFGAATRRWVEYQAPSFGAVVVVTDEADVRQTVSKKGAQYCRVTLTVYPGAIR